MEANSFSKKGAPKRSLREEGMKAPPIYMAPRKSSFAASCRSSKVHPITVEKWHPQERIKVVTERAIFRQMVPTNTHLRRSPHGMRKEDLGGTRMGRTVGSPQFAHKFYRDSSSGGRKTILRPPNSLPIGPKSFPFAGGGLPSLSWVLTAPPSPPLRPSPC